MLKHKHFIRIGIFIFILSLFSGCSSLEKNKNNKKINVLYFDYYFSLPCLVAKDLGYFEEENIIVNLTYVPKFKLIWKFIKQDNVDVISGIFLIHFLQLENNYLFESYITLVSQSDKTKSVSAILAKDTTFPNKEIKMGIPRTILSNLIAKFSWNNFIQDVDFPKENITFFNSEPEAGITNYLLGEINSIFLLEPYETFLVKKNKAKIIIDAPLEKYFVNPMIYGVDIISKEFIKKYPDLAKKYIKSIYKAIDFIENNPRQAKEILGYYFNFIPEEIILSSNIFTYTKSPELDLSTFNKNIEAIFKSKALPFKKDYSKKLLRAPILKLK